MLAWSELLDEINELFIKVTRDKIFKNEKEDFLLHVKQCLKLNNIDDWNYILASEDILEDSNTAIRNFLKFGTSGPTKYGDIGEKYLRLYGVLNATYLQQQAILNLFKFFQCPKVTELKKEIDDLEIREIRNKLGSHSVNYEDKFTNKMHAFVPVRIEINDFECAYFNHLTNEYVNVNLKTGIEEHLKLMCSSYYKIFCKSVKTIYKNDPDKIENIIKIASPFKEMINGAILMKIESGGFIIHTVL